MCIKNSTLTLLICVHKKTRICVTKMPTLKTRKCNVIWLVNFNIPLKFSANIKDSMGKFIMPLENEMKEMNEKLGCLMASVENSTEKG